MNNQPNAKTSKKKFMDSIKTKLILMIVLVVAIPVIAITVISAMSAKNSITQSTININDAQAQIIEQSIITILDQNFRAMETLADSPSTIQYLSSEDTTQNADLVQQIKMQLKRMDENLNDGNTTVITGADGHQRLRSSGDLVDVSEREYFKEAMQGKEYVTDIQVSKTTGARITTLAAPVKNKNGEIIGIVQRNYNLSDFHELLKNEVIEDKQEILMVDRTGSVIAHSARDIDPNNPEDQSMNPFYTDSRGEKVSGSYDAPWDGMMWMISWYKEPRTGWVVASCRVTSVALKDANTTVIVMSVIGIVFLVVFGIAAFFISRLFTAPIEEINVSLSALADGRFQMIKKHADRKDEFGDMVRGTNSVIEKLRTIVAGIKNSAASVGDSSDELADMTARITQTSEDVSNAVQEIAEGATQQAAEIQDAVENTALISENIQKVTENAESVTMTANEMSENSKESRAQLQRLKDSSDDMSKAIEAITDKISATEEAVERISDKVESINSIASQTNLLALNASIEAARAGETGRGFAVVAEEIGKLADESSASADEIRTEMDLLLKESQSAVEMAKKVSFITENEQKKILNETVASIGKLIHGIEVSVEGIETITASAERCEDSKAGITDSMNGLSAISEENAAASEETAASMQQLGSIVSSLSEDARSLKEISNSLISDINFFKDE